MARYYVDSSEASLADTAPRIIYDNQDGLPVVILCTQANKWTDERQALLETILKAVNGDQA